MVPKSATMPELANVPAPEYVADGNWCLSVPELEMEPELERVPELKRIVPELVRVPELVMVPELIVSVNPDGIVNCIPELIVSVSLNNTLKGVKAG